MKEVQTKYKLNGPILYGGDNYKKGKSCLPIKERVNGHGGKDELNRAVTREREAGRGNTRTVK